MLTAEQSKAIVDEYIDLMDREKALLDTVEDELKSLRAHRRKA